MSRTVNGERLFGAVEKEMLRRQIWLVADYCGVLVSTYSAMENHFHVLLNVPKKNRISDDELLRRYSVLHPDHPQIGFSRVAAIRLMLAEDGPEAENWRLRQLEMMGDVSPFMQLLKQRFSIWYNKNHGRFGTLWSERFKSVLIENSPRTLQAFATYIDLNAVRAGLVTDPKDYRFCGYGEAVAGSEKAREGLEAVFNAGGWNQVQAEYRKNLYYAALAGRDDQATLPQDLLEKVLSEGGQLPLAVVLRCRLKYMTDSVVLGSQTFVLEQLESYRRITGRGHRLKPKPLPPVTDWSGIMAMRL